MADREKVVEHLYDCVATSKPENMWFFVRKDIVEDALDLLKEQEPVKPCVAVDTWICPKCGHTLESQSLIDDKENPQVLVHELYSFCPNCGKAVKWDDA